MEKQLWNKCVEFHGHQCPGLAIGFRASEIAAAELGEELSALRDEEIVCITENDACGVDAVQYITGCTIGKGNLIYRPRGKMAFSFFSRTSGKSVRIVLKPNATYGMERPEAQHHILSAPVDDVFWIKKPEYTLPETARLFNSIVCEACGESAPEHMMRLEGGKKVCLDCFTQYSRGW